MKKLDKVSPSVIHCPKCGSSEAHLELRALRDPDSGLMVRYIYCLTCTRTTWEKDNESIM